jgi:hypothetical protein
MLEEISGGVLDIRVLTLAPPDENDPEENRFPRAGAGPKYSTVLTSTISWNRLDAIRLWSMT